MEQKEINGWFQSSSQWHMYVPHDNPHFIGTHGKKAEDLTQVGL